MIKQWINTILRIWILIPLLSVSGTVFALESQSTFDLVIMGAVDDSSIIHEARNDMKINNMADLHQCGGQCGHYHACVVPLGERSYFSIGHYFPKCSYHTKPRPAYLAELIKPPRAKLFDIRPDQNFKKILTG